MKKHCSALLFSSLLLAAVMLLTACQSSAQVPQVQATATINPAFQLKTTPAPTIPPYRCGAWSSVNNPGTGSTITIYARLTKNIAGVSGATATATANFANGSLTLAAHPTSDSGGYVTFSLSLEGRQPAKTPATVDVSFKVGQATVNCSPAFFTPR